VTSLPVALNLENRAVLVVGGGAVGARKAAAFADAGARVTIVSPQLNGDFPAVEFREKRYESADCSGFFLICACTDSREVNAQIARDAKAQGILCNLADDPKNSDFHTMATIRRGEITVGVATGGLSPVLSRHIKAKIEAALGEEYALLLEIAGSYRIETKMRGAFWRLILESEILALLREGERAKAVQKLEMVVKSLAQS